MRKSTISARVGGLFAVSAASPALATAQLSALKQQVPLLYLLLLINSAALAYTHYGVAPTALVVLPPLLLGTVFMTRGIAWLRLKVALVPPKNRHRLLRRTQRLTMLFSPCILFWSFGLAQYGDEVSNLHVFFFLALTPIGCIFCLMHLRSAALFVAASVSTPAVLFLLHRRGAVQTSIAINLLLVVAVMLFIVLTYYRDFVRLVEQNEALEQLGEANLQMAATDMLTSLPNRRSFFPALDAAVAQAKVGARDFLLGIIDLDGFKGINDTYGHVAGDEVLIEVATRLRSAVPAAAVLARLGGDEFALIVHDETGAWELDRLSRAILASISLPFSCAGTNVRIGASIGFARTEADVTAEQMVEHADFALYEAKAHSRGTWTLFAEEHRARMRLQNAVEESLRHADLVAELSVAFQPMVDVTRERTIAFEALARWDSPVLGRVPPDRFIAIAERTGLVGEITAVLLGKALEQLGTWPDDVVLSFNLSMVDITTPDAVSRVCDMVTRSSIDPGRIQFEVTETAMLGDFDQAASGLNRLRELGTQLALDDFGTGYSSLAHLHRLPVDKLKIDQSFTRELATSNTARNIVASTLGLARSLGLDCVVEGVETQEQAIILRSYGCRTMQGYLFHKPMAADAVAAYLAEEVRQQEATPVSPLSAAAAVLQRGAMERRRRAG